MNLFPISFSWLKLRLIIVFALALCIGLPIVLNYMQGNQNTLSPEDADRELVIISPHNETIRRELGEAFQTWWKKKSGESVYVNWLTPGGTSEIRMVIDSRFAAAKKTKTNGISIDLLFGGGDYLYKQQAKKNRLEKLKVFTSHPKWFSSDVIPATFTGETYYDANHQWVGVCLSRFGICYNIDALKRRGLTPPTQWSDLTDPRYFGGIALADPTKSGSAARAFEMIIQQQIQKAKATLPRKPGETPKQYEMRLRSEGWDNGLNIIQKIAANSRYFTDSATKIPRDVAQGDAVAGMCIDFYGYTYEEMLKHKLGKSRIQWVAPKNGTSMSVDPVAVFKGAPNPKLAQAFVEFLLTKEGQSLWSNRPGTPNGPKHRALHRMPIRRDIYTKENNQYFAIPSNPYHEMGEFSYDRRLTGHGFAAIRFIIRIMCIDTHDELKNAWKQLILANYPPRATKIFSDLTVVSYQNAMGGITKKVTGKDKIKTAHMAMRLGKFLRKNYNHAAKLAKEGK